MANQNQTEIDIHLIGKTKWLNYDKKENVQNIDNRSNTIALSMGHWLFYSKRRLFNTPAPPTCCGTIYC